MPRQLSPREQLQVLVDHEDLDLEVMLYRKDQDLFKRNLRMPQFFEHDNYLRGYHPDRRQDTVALAIDCEMVGVGYRGKKSALGRVSVVNYWGYPVLDLYVQPNSPITHWRTKWSGLSPEVFEQAEEDGNLVNEYEAKEMVRDRLEGSKIVGHSVSFDLRALGLNRQDYKVVDTQKWMGNVFDLGNQVGLKRAMKSIFDIDIQEGQGHDSVEDAQAAMLLFRAMDLIG